MTAQSGGTGHAPSSRELKLEEAVIRSEAEAVEHLCEEQQHLLDSISGHVSSNRMLTTENQRLRSAVAELEHDKIGSPNHAVLETKSAELRSTQTELDEVKCDLDLKTVESENLKLELELLKA